MKMPKEKKKFTISRRATNDTGDTDGLVRQNTRTLVLRSTTGIKQSLNALLKISVSDPHKFSCGSGSRIPKMSIWIRMRIQGGNH